MDEETKSNINDIFLNISHYSPEELALGIRTKI